MRKFWKLLICLYISTMVNPLAAQSVQEKELHRANDLVFHAYEQMLIKRNYSEARYCFTQAAEIYGRINGEQDKKYLEVLYGLADVCEKQNDIDAALAYLARYAHQTTKNQARSLRRLGQLYLKSGDISRAEESYRRCIALFESDSIRWNSDISGAYRELADLQGKSCNYQAALTTYRKYLSNEERFNGRMNKYATGLGEIAIILHKMGMDQEALDYHEQSLATMTEAHMLDRNSFQYANLLNNMGLSYKSLGNYTKAHECLELSLDIKEKLFGKHTLQYASSLSNLGDLLAKEGNYSTAENILKQCITIYRTQNDTLNVSYMRVLGSLGVVYNDKGDYSQALEYCRTATEYYKLLLGEEHHEYATALDNLASVYSNKGDYETALDIYNRAATIYAHTIGKNNPIYALTLNNIGTIHMHRDEVSDAKIAINQAKDILEHTRGPKHPDYFATINNLAVISKEEGDYKQANKYHQMQVDKLREAYGELNPDYILALNNWGAFLAEMGDYSRAFELLHHCEKLQEAVEIEDLRFRATILYNIGMLRESLGDFLKADRYYTQAAELYCSTVGAEHPAYANLLRTRAGLYCCMGDYNSAAQYYQQAIKIIGYSLGETHTAYARVLNSAGSMYNNTVLYRRGQTLLNQALDICERNPKRDPLLYASVLNNLAVNYYLCNDMQRALMLFKRSADIYCQFVGKQHPNYLASCIGIGDVAFASGDYKRATDCWEEIFEVTRNNMRRDFAFLSRRERANYWSQQQPVIQNIFVLGTGPVNERIAGLIYDAALLNKGLLLNSELELKRIVYESGDSELQSCYEELVRLHAQRTHMFDQTDEFSSLKTQLADSLGGIIDSTERKLQHLSQVYGDYTSHSVISWRDVRNQLEDEDTAIEIISYGYKADTLYDAVVLRKGWKSPRHIPLYSVSEIRRQGISMNDMKIYDRPDWLGSRIWKPLHPFLSDKGRIYFVPSGELHAIGVEYLLMDDSTRMCDCYDIVRLSSTRELVLHKKLSPTHTAALFGGLNYNTTVDDMSFYISTNSLSSSSNRFRTFASHHSLWNYLPGTRREVMEIESSLANQGYTTKLFIGDDGVEEQFKALSGLRTAFIHIATHGFFLPKERIINKSGSQIVEDEDAVLRCTGLVCSGANNAWIGRAKLPDGIDDGILTADEIASLDFRGTDIVVLSACQTGLGEITGEGVFGLQRAFKKAGAQSLIMSLWAVSDEATRIMMSRFYDELSKGVPKRIAFRAAQQHLKKETFTIDGRMYSGSNPLFWASFILLD